MPLTWLVRRGELSFETGSFPLGTMDDEMISECKPVGSKVFHSFENVKNTESELLSMANETFIMHQPEHNSSIFGFQETTPTKVAENAATALTKIMENAAIKQLKEVEDPTLHTHRLQVKKLMFLWKPQEKRQREDQDCCHLVMLTL